VNKRNVVLIVLAAGALVTAGILVVRQLDTPRDAQDFPDGIAWVCTNPGCEHGFTVTLDAMSDFFAEHPDEDGMPCPKCGGNRTVRAIRCPRCQRYYPRELARGAGGGGACPFCEDNSE
jgi:hypothetical protein